MAVFTQNELVFSLTQCDCCSAGAAVSYLLITTTEIITLQSQLFWDFQITESSKCKSAFDTFFVLHLQL